jgi:hypothetical protein
MVDTSAPDARPARGRLARARRRRCGNRRAPPIASHARTWAAGRRFSLPVCSGRAAPGRRRCVTRGGVHARRCQLAEVCSGRAAPGRRRCDARRCARAEVCSGRGAGPDVSHCAHGARTAAVTRDRGPMAGPVYLTIRAIGGPARIVLIPYTLHCKYYICIDCIRCTVKYFTRLFMTLYDINIMYKIWHARCNDMRYEPYT